MEPTLRPLPVGFRFRPSDVEISNYFLKKKALGQTMKTRTVPEECHDVFSRHPRDLPGDPKDKHRYFYHRKHKNQDTTNSLSMWTPMGGETNVLAPCNNDEIIGIKRAFTLVEQEEESDNDIYMSDEEVPPKYNWYLDEISLPSRVAETDWVFCHIFCKKKNMVPECVEVPMMESDSESESEFLDEDGTVGPPSPP